MQRLNILFLVAIVYFGGHFISGVLICQDEFCPGDRESDWVYEFQDDDGKKYVVVQGLKIPQEQYDANFEERK